MKKILNYIWSFIFEGLVMSFIAVLGAYVYLKMHIDDFFKKFRKKKKS